MGGHLGSQGFFHAIGNLFHSGGSSCIHDDRGAVFTGIEAAGNFFFDFFANGSRQGDNLFTASQMLAYFFSLYGTGRGRLNDLILTVIIIDFPYSFGGGHKPGIFAGGEDFFFVKINGFLQARITAGFLGIYGEQGRIINRHELTTLNFFYCFT